MGGGDPQPERIIGRYAVFGEIAAGGMATVHLGRLIGPAGFARIVAIKKLHPQFAKDPEFVSMFLDEARLAGRIRHPNVVSSLDVVALEGELFIVMDYVEGESVSRLRRAAAERGQRVPVPVAVAVMVNALHGLHAAHETLSEVGSPLGLIHRDISPQNILVGVDGVARVVDFGVAKAAGRLQFTREGVVKGKIAYMAPEQLRRGTIDRRIDIYAASVVLWELLSGQRLFTGDNDFQIAEQIIREGVTKPPSAFNPEVATALDQVVLSGACVDAGERPTTALELADLLEQAVPMASPRAVGKVVESLAAPELERRAKQIFQMEGASASAPSMAGLAADSSSVSEVSLPHGTELGAIPAQSASTASGTQHTLPVDSAAAARAAARGVPVAPAQPIVAPAPRVLAPESVSAVSRVTFSVQPPAARSRAGLMIGLGALAALLVVALVVVIGFALNKPEPAEASVVLVSGASSGAVTPPPEPKVIEPKLAHAEPRPKPEPAPSTKPPRAPAPTGVPPATAAPKSKPKPKADPCNPPHYYDDKGIKRFKPGCDL